MAQLSLRLSGEATEPEHVAHEYFRHRYERIRLVVHNSIEDSKAQGRVSSDVDPDAVAALIFASWDGLQIQWMYDKTVDVRAHMTYLVRALGVDVRTPTTHRGT